MKQSSEIGIDILLSQSIRKSLEEDLGKPVMTKIENRLSEKFDSDLYDAVLNFQKMDIVLREIYGKGADGIEDRVFKRMLEINTSKKDKNVSTITIKDSSVIKTALGLIGDHGVQQILKVLSPNNEKQDGNYMTKQEMINATNMTQTIGYAKIDSMIRCGLLEVKEHGESKIDKRRVAKYQTSFNNLTTSINSSGDVSANITVSNEHVKNSNILTVINP